MYLVRDKYDEATFSNYTDALIWAGNRSSKYELTVKLYEVDEEIDEEYLIATFIRGKMVDEKRPK